MEDYNSMAIRILQEYANAAGIETTKSLESPCPQGAGYYFSYKKRQRIRIEFMSEAERSYVRKAVQEHWLSDPDNRAEGITDLGRNELSRLITERDERIRQDKKLKQENEQLTLKQKQDERDIERNEREREQNERDIERNKREKEHLRIVNCSFWLSVASVCIALVSIIVAISTCAVKHVTPNFASSCKKPDACCLPAAAGTTVGTKVLLFKTPVVKEDNYSEENTADCNTEYPETDTKEN